MAPLFRRTLLTEENYDRYWRVCIGSCCLQHVKSSDVPVAILLDMNHAAFYAALQYRESHHKTLRFGCRECKQKAVRFGGFALQTPSMQPVCSARWLVRPRIIVRSAMRKRALTRSTRGCVAPAAFIQKTFFLSETNFCAFTNNKDKL